MATATVASITTSNFMIGVTAAAGAVAYFLRREIVTAIAGPAALGSVAGALLSARVLMRVSNDRLRVLFVAVLPALVVQMLLEAFNVHLFGASA
ncbi:TSUP family transporter [Paraburkholderia xenovorans]|uniref:TSUP family transporter n=1 Tax=Paraburkholderia xenovorans TaxID=36873 RepID=UPI0038B84686